jgi:hypothetical protein
MAREYLVGADEIGAAGGVAPLDGDGFVPEENLPERLGADAIMAQVQTAVGALVAGAPGALDTLNELAAALGDDQDFAAHLATTLNAIRDVTDLTLLAALASKIGDSGSSVGAAVAASAAQVVAAGAVTPSGKQPARARDFPGYAGVPTTDTGLGTITVGAANAASAIAGSVVFAPTQRRFRRRGVKPVYGTVFPQTLGWDASVVYSLTASPPTTDEFVIDTPDGQFEISTKASDAAFRVLVNGKYMAAPINTGNDGSGRLVKVALTAGAGVYRIGIEADSVFKFWGIRADPATGFAPTPRRFVAVQVGDSFDEPTVVKAGGLVGSALFGIPQQNAYLTGWEIRPAGLGGTGLVNPNAGAGRVKYAARLPELVAANPDADAWIIDLSGNDQGYTAAQVLAEATAVVTALRGYGFTRYGQIIFRSCYWPRGGETVPTSILAQHIAVKAYCAAQGVVFVDLLTPPGLSTTAGVLSSAAAAGASTVQTATQFVIGRWVLLGTASTYALKLLTNVTGSGPYTLTFAGGLPAALVSGDPVIEVGESEIPTALVARYTGNGVDTTHPTPEGSAHRARMFVAELSRQLPD